MLGYLPMDDCQFTTISPDSHEIVNYRIVNGLANDLTDFFEWNRPFKHETVDVKLLELMQATNIVI